jgi:CcmD family protein
MPDGIGYLASAFIAAWVILGVYLVHVSRTQRRLAERIDRLERSAEPPPG